jgi:hypothetical protein
MANYKPAVLLNYGQSVLNKLFSLYSLANAAAQSDIAAWAYSAQSSLVALLDKIPRENPIKPLIPPPDQKPPQKG